jgi:hypothetical protein
MEWFSPLSLALGSAWTSGINLYATVSVLGLLQRFTSIELPGGLDVLDNWWIIGIAGGLYIIEFVADKVPYIDSVWDVIHTFVRVPAGAIIAYSATTDMDAAIVVAATLLGGGLALSSHGTKAAVRGIANMSPEPVSNWALSIGEDILAFTGTLLAVLAPIIVAIFLVLFGLSFLWFAPKVFRAIKRMLSATKALITGAGLKEVAREAP